MNPTLPNRLTLICGGPSAEHKISVLSAKGVYEALVGQGLELRVVGISKKGLWLELPDPYIAFDVLEITDSMSERYGGTRLNFSFMRDAGVIFPVLHGPFGEDGTIQGMLETLQLPYLGSGILSSSVAMNKAFSKRLFEQAKLEFVPYLYLTRHEWTQAQSLIENRINKRFPNGSVFVKPACMGSSIGIHRVDHRSKLAVAINHALRYNDSVIVEKHLDNIQEVECAILGGDTPHASSLGEIVTHKQFYDYEQKYTESSTTDCIIPAVLDPETTLRVKRASLKAFNCLDCYGFARVDCFVERGSKRVLINEVNTIPGFTPISMFTKLWAHTGVGYHELMQTLMQLAVSRFEHKHSQLLEPDLSLPSILNGENHPDHKLVA